MILCGSLPTLFSSRGDSNQGHASSVSASPWSDGTVLSLAYTHVGDDGLLMHPAVSSALSQQAQERSASGMPAAGEALTSPRSVPPSLSPAFLSGIHFLRLDHCGLTARSHPVILLLIASCPRLVELSLLGNPLGRRGNAPSSRHGSAVSPGCGSDHACGKGENARKERGVPATPLQDFLFELLRRWDVHPTLALVLLDPWVIHQPYRKSFGSDLGPLADAVEGVTEQQLDAKSFQYYYNKLIRRRQPLLLRYYNNKGGPIEGTSNDGDKPVATIQQTRQQQQQRMSMRRAAPQCYLDRRSVRSLSLHPANARLDSAGGTATADAADDGALLFTSTIELKQIIGEESSLPATIMGWHQNEDAAPQGSPTEALSDNEMENDGDEQDSAGQSAEPHTANEDDSDGEAHPVNMRSAADAGDIAQRPALALASGLWEASNLFKHGLLRSRRYKTQSPERASADGPNAEQDGGMAVEDGSSGPDALRWVDQRLRLGLGEMQRRAWLQQQEAASYRRINGLFAAIREKIVARFGRELITMMERKSDEEGRDEQNGGAAGTATAGNAFGSQTAPHESCPPAKRASFLPMVTGTSVTEASRKPRGRTLLSVTAAGAADLSTATAAGEISIGIKGEVGGTDKRPQQHGTSLRISDPLMAPGQSYAGNAGCQASSVNPSTAFATLLRGLMHNMQKQRRYTERAEALEFRSILQAAALPRF